MWPFKDKKQKLERAKAALLLAKKAVDDLELKIKEYPGDYGTSPADFLKTNIGKNLLNRLNKAKRELSIAEARIKELES